jgi:hypothetical protein
LFKIQLTLIFSSYFRFFLIILSEVLFCWLFWVTDLTWKKFFPLRKMLKLRLLWFKFYQLICPINGSLFYVYQSLTKILTWTRTLHFLLNLQYFNILSLLKYELINFICQFSYLLFLISVFLLKNTITMSIAFFSIFFRHIKVKLFPL